MAEQGGHGKSDTSTPLSSPSSEDTVLMEHCSEEVFEMRQTPDRGIGLFAKRDIPRGQCILSEPPLVVCPPGEDVVNLWKPFAKMTSVQLSKFYELSCSMKSVNLRFGNAIRNRLGATRACPNTEIAVNRELTMLAIFFTNSVSMGPHCMHGCGVFEMFSRINHSCTPNAHNCYNATIGHEVVYATKDIPEGDEITTTYVYNAHVREKRQARLERFNFLCTCAACEGTEFAVHEARRRRLFNVDRALFLMEQGIAVPGMRAPIPIPGTHEEALAWAEENLTLLMEEGLMGMGLALS